MSGKRVQHYERMEEAVLLDPMYFQHRNEQNAELRRAMRDAAALGYAQALRDMINGLDPSTDPRLKAMLGPTQEAWCAERVTNWIRSFAAENGIDIN